MPDSTPHECVNVPLHVRLRKGSFKATQKPRNMPLSLFRLHYSQGVLMSELGRRASGLHLAVALYGIHKYLHWAGKTVESIRKNGRCLQFMVNFKHYLAYTEGDNSSNVACAPSRASSALFKFNYFGTRRARQQSFPCHKPMKIRTPF